MSITAFVFGNVLDFDVADIDIGVLKRAEKAITGRGHSGIN
jgi:hypothetical protein